MDRRTFLATGLAAAGARKARPRSIGPPSSATPAGETTVIPGCWTVEMVMGIYQAQKAGARVSFPLKSVTDISELLVENLP